eukprot:1127925-Alexandrium_andersonii.AAC.1
MTRSCQACHHASGMTERHGGTLGMMLARCLRRRNIWEGYSVRLKLMRRPDKLLVPVGLKPRWERFDRCLLCGHALQ